VSFDGNSDNFDCVDYEHSTTIPIPGDNIKAGSWMRWYLERLCIVSCRVSPILFS
jgi:hypothetical protein